MAIGKRSNAPVTTTSRPDVHSTTKEQVEGGEVVGGLGVDRIVEILLRGTPLHPELELDIDNLILYSRICKETIDTIDGVRKSFSEEIMSRLCAEGSVEHLTPDGWKAQMLIGRTASSVNVKRLVERGVDPDVIKSCTDAGAEYSYIKIVKAKGDK